MAEPSQPNASGGSEEPENRFLRAHKYLQKNYPLAYEAAQILPPVGVAGGALDAAEALQQKDMEGVAKGVLSMVPVLGRYRVGSKIASSVRQAAGAADHAGKKEIAVGLAKKSAAGENVAEAGEAGYAEGKLRKEQASSGYKRGGTVATKPCRGDGIARKGKTKGRMI